MDSNKYDFSGWATRSNIRCSDGRTILPNAFSENDGCSVPLVWNHNHNDIDNVLGHADLENRPDGVYAYCAFNDTISGQMAKSCVEHGDIVSLSIYANKLRESNKVVSHGMIREVSLVLAGANPGALIDNVIEHGEELDDAAIMYFGEDIQLPENDGEIEHSDSKSSDDKSKNDDSENKNMADNKSNGMTAREVYDDMNDAQKECVAIIVGLALQQEQGNSDEEDEENMKHNIFDNEDEGSYISHAEIMQDVMKDVRQGVHFEDSVLQHAEDYGIRDIETLFPEPQSLNTPPEFIKRDTSWVGRIMNNVHHTPFSRIKSRFADITGDEARAKGYITGTLKKEEVFSLLKRTTFPTTIYKKQKFDRDDLIDITDFDVIAMIRSEMRMMLDEELARAILIGDGRLPSSEDKVNEENIRPIWTDHDLFTIKSYVKVSADQSEDEQARNLIKAMIKARKNYKGTGNPTFFTTEDTLINCLLIEDTTGRRLYNDVSDVARAMRVSDIVTVEVMEGVSHTVNVGTDGAKKTNLAGIIVNPADYNIGMDRGGAVQMYDAFDIDYNQQKYLLETRCSGALIKPYSAISIETYTA